MAKAKFVKLCTQAGDMKGWPFRWAWSGLHDPWPHHILGVGKARHVKFNA